MISPEVEQWWVENDLGRSKFDKRNSADYRIKEKLDDCDIEQVHSAISTVWYPTLTDFLKFSWYWSNGIFMKLDYMCIL